ncbi:GTP cyclohydrolase I [Chondromyces apiculatus]|uniref:GTP cyclohydrolase I n=1 Tax=Chondromyces apiculatus DSM 436 TaxID=1192034 RepID=A0A017TAY0_9BACT|nr:GTP cyclohydrolase I [Chondromyces apiculatus]EYF05980.1 GTP cyclohydrolase I [Chondromyces apiculatus DSM 436]
MRRVIDRKAAARAVEDFLRALGHDIEGELVGTGERVADAFADDLLKGHGVDPGALLRDGAMAASAHERGLVILRDLWVDTMCPHHLLPGHGTATIAYLPGDRVAGIGTIARVVDALSQRLTLQERIGGQLVDLLVEDLGARGALCKISLTHTCLVARGERKTGTVVDTLAASGVLARPSPERDLAIAALLR